MGAKQKLNAASWMGSLVIAGLLGGVTGSPALFVVSLVGLLIADVLSGNIRR